MISNQPEKDGCPGETKWEEPVDWTVFKITVPGFALVMLIFTFLEIPLKFEIETSPTWQLSLFYLALAIFLSTITIVFRMEPGRVDKRNRSINMGLPLLATATVFAISITGGASLEIRDERIFGLVMASIGYSMISYMVIIIPIGAFHTGKALLHWKSYGSPTKMQSPQQSGSPKG